MNGKFIRVNDEDLLGELLISVGSSAKTTDYVLGIPRSNINPLTLDLGNTKIELHPRNAVPNTGSLTAYDDRKNLKTAFKCSPAKAPLILSEEVTLYSVLDKINNHYGLSLTKNDVYDTSIKEFPNKKLFIVLLARPESLYYHGKHEIEVLHSSNDISSLTIELVATIVDLDKLPVSIELRGTVIDSDNFYED